jgi:chromosome segregation ATPase
MTIVEKDTELSVLQEYINNANSEKIILNQKIVQLEMDMKVNKDNIASEIQFKMDSVENEMESVNLENAAKKEEIINLEAKLKVTESAMSTCEKTRDELKESLRAKQEELSEVVAKVAELQRAEGERRELVEVLQEREEQEQGLRRQVVELQEMVQEQVHGKQSLAASLEAARKEVEAVFGRQASLEAEVAAGRVEVAEATQTAQLRLEKTRVVELQLEELTMAKEKLVVELER